MIIRAVRLEADETPVVVAVRINLGTATIGPEMTGLAPHSSRLSFGSLRTRFVDHSCRLNRRRLWFPSLSCQVQIRPRSGGHYSLDGVDQTVPQEPRCSRLESCPSWLRGESGKYKYQVIRASNPPFVPRRWIRTHEDFLPNDPRAAFEAGRSPSRLVGKTERRLAVLEDKLRRKDEVIAEIMEDLVRTKKNLGES